MIHLDNIKIVESKNLVYLKSAYKLIKKSYWGNFINKEKFDIQNDNTKTFFIFNRRTLIGFFRLVTDGFFIVYIMDFIIKEKYQQKGIGSKTIQYIEALFPYSKILLLSNKSGDFYLKNDFKRIDKSDNFFIKTATNNV